MEKQLPQFIELEEIILGILLSDSKACNIIFNNLRSTDFYKSDHQLIFEAAKRGYDKGVKTDIITVASELKGKGVPTVYLMELTSKVNSTLHLEDHIAILKDYSARREFIAECHQAINKAHDYDTKAKELISQTVLNCETLGNRVQVENELDFKNYSFKVFEETKKHNSVYLGIPSGWSLLDKHTSGFSKGDLIIVSAGAGEGKSSFALNVASRIKEGRTLFFSYEMKKQQLVWKLMAAEMDLSVTDIRSGRATAAQMEGCKFYDNDLLINDKCPELSEMVSYCKYEKAKCIKEGIELKAIFIDYLQLIPLGIYSKRGQTRNDEVSTITRKLKMLAMELDIPIIALSQVSRDKARKTYVLADLRESGAIEQDADGVIFIWRPIAHNHTEYNMCGEVITTDRTDAFFIIAKWRLGEVGEFRMKFRGEFSRFEDYRTDDFNMSRFENVPF